MTRLFPLLLALSLAACVDGGAPDKNGPDNPGGDDATGGDASSAGDVGHTGGDEWQAAGDGASGGDSWEPAGDEASGGDEWQAAGDEPPGGDSYAPGDSWLPGPELNPGWVGGACEGASDCDDANYSEAALCEKVGFPNGMCTQMCTGGGSYCPDADSFGAGTGYTVTRCIDSIDGPRCVAECDFSQSDTGCRAGYACVRRLRYNSTTVFSVCLPADIQRWPGEAAPSFDIGDACGSDAGCEHSACLPLTGGYCSKTMCEFSGCPNGSTCFFVSADETACLDACTDSSQCRETDNYICDQDDVCWPGAPIWDSSVGAQDCADAWQGLNGSGLSACDTTADNYVVVRKSVRNLALCNSGGLAYTGSNFWVGLGNPMGDKEQRGDARTPEGIFYVAALVPGSSYYLALLLSYPDSDDAERGYNAGLISLAERDDIQASQTSCGYPDQGTDLGGLIEIHGEGGGVYGDWTLGCIAIENDEMDEVWSRMGVGDTIVVLP